MNAFDLDRRGYPVGNLDAPRRHRRPAVAGSDFRPPADRQLRLIEPLDDAVLGPKSVSVRPTPLWPVSTQRRDGRDRNYDCHEHRRFAHN